MKIVSIWGQNVNPDYTGGHSSVDVFKIQACGGAVIELENGKIITALIENYSAGERVNHGFVHIVIVDAGQTMAEVISDTTYDGYDSPVDIWKIASQNELQDAYGIDINKLEFELVPAIREAAIWSWDKNPVVMPAIWTDANVPFAGWADGFEVIDGAYDLFGVYKVEIKNGIAEAVLTENGGFVDYAFSFLRREAMDWDLKYEPLSLAAYINKLYLCTVGHGCPFFRRRKPDSSGARYACGIDIENVKSKPMPTH